MSIQNGDWSTAGATPGFADQWSIAAEYRGEEVAAFDEAGVDIGHEGFELEWLDELTDLMVELAAFTQNPPARVEDFEAGWPDYAPFLWDLAAEEQALFDGGTLAVEGFESVPWVVPVYEDALFYDALPPAPHERPRETFNVWPYGGFVGGGPVSALFDAGANDYEDFEGTWTLMETI